jgi:hypothetical protein
MHQFGVKNMPNPTLSNPSQFNKPFNILPDIIYTNPTVIAKKQFNKPFNILPDLAYTNPTAPGPQFAALPGLGGLYYRLPSDSFGTSYSYDSSLENSEKIDEAGDARVINWRPSSYISTNISVKTSTFNLLGLASSVAGSVIGIPQIGQVGQSLVQGLDDSLSGTYSTLPLSKLKSIPGVLYPDFRSRIKIDGSQKDNSDDETWFRRPNQALGYATALRLDGLSASRRSLKSIAYAAATASPLGPYSIFNLDGAGKSGFGWGDHDNPNAVRKDFTMRSHVAKDWNYGTRTWAPTTNLIERGTPFRGDKVNVIDFGTRKLDDAYLWNPNQISEILGMNLNPLGITQDFIKFYMTGPKLTAGNLLDKDDIIVFRAVLTGLDDSFTANWSPVQMIGRADPNYIYTGYGRDLSVSFTIYATDRDELQPIYRKLNALAGYTAPTYDPTSIAMEGPWMRLTIGDLFVQQPVVLSSLSYTYDVGDAPWEINIENDPFMMQVPLKISVQLQFNVISDYLPQKGGRFYTLAKRFDSTTATPKAGNDNWLSDASSNIGEEFARQRLRERLRTASGRVVEQG